MAKAVVDLEKNRFCYKIGELKDSEKKIKTSVVTSSLVPKSATGQKKHFYSGIWIG